MLLIWILVKKVNIYRKIINNASRCGKEKNFFPFLPHRVNKRLCRVRRKQAEGRKLGNTILLSMIIGKNGSSGENPCATFFPIAVTKGKSLSFPLRGRRLHCSLAQHASATLVRLHHITFPPSKQQPPTYRASKQASERATSRTNGSLPERAPRAELPSYNDDDDDPTP
jgi:hypothetical protein